MGVLARKLNVSESAVFEEVNRFEKKIKIEKKEVKGIGPQKTEKSM